MSGISLGRVTTVLLLTRMAGFALATGNSVILARGLGASGLGVYAYATGIAAIVGLMSNMGVSTLLTRTIARDPDDSEGATGLAFAAQGVLAVAVLVAVPAFTMLLPRQPVPLAYAMLAAAQVAIGTLSWPYLAVLAGLARYDRIARVELLAAVAGTATLLAAALLRGGVVAFLVAHLGAAVVSVLIARHVARPFLPRRTVRTLTLTAFLRGSIPFGGVSALQSLYTRLDILLLGQLAASVALGLYSAAYKPVTLAVYFGSTVAATLFPVMARGGDVAGPPSFHRAMRSLGAAAPAMALVITGLAAPLLRLLYGVEFEAAAPVLILLGWSAAANWLYAPLGVTLQARGREIGWMGCLTGGLLLNAAANLWAIPRWGPVGAAGATLASEALIFVLASLLVTRRRAVALSFRPLVLTLGAAGAAGAVLWLLHAAGPVPSTVAACVVYGGLLLLLRVVTSGDLLVVMGWVRQAAPGWSRV